MKKTTFVLACAFLLSMPCQLCADNDAHQIRLTEVQTSDNPSTRDDGGGGESGQGDPNAFSAIINGHVLSVGVSGSGPWTPHLRVYKADGTLVTNRRFLRTISVNLADTGYYTLTLTLGTLTFQGEFEIVD